MKMRASYRRLAISLLALFCLIGLQTAPSLAWGTKGHRIVAIIAAHYLSNSARQEVSKLLGGDSMASIANDADEIRRTHPETGPWHFVDIPKDAYTYEQ